MKKLLMMAAFAGMMAFPEVLAETESIADNTYTVYIPDVVEMRDQSSEYIIRVDGILGKYEQIDIVPEATITLTEEGTVDPKDPVTATVVLDRTDYHYDELAKGAVNGSGRIYCEDLSAGNWKGQVSFSISKRLEDGVHHLEYHENGGTMPSTYETLHKNETETILPNASKTGYTFQGWSLSEDLSDPMQVLSGTYETDPIVLYASFEPNTYTLSFDSAGGTSVGAKTVTYDQTIGTLSTPIRTGYTFLGWYDTNGKQVTESTIYQTVGNTTLTAKWQANTYTLSFDSNGGSAVNAKTVTYDQTIGTLSTPTRTGHTFLGWYDSAGKQVTASTVYQTAENSTLTAQWQVNAYTVTWLNSSGNALKNTSYQYGTSVPASAFPSQSNTQWQIFAGWKNTSSGAITGAFTMPAGNVTLQATYRQKSGAFVSGNDMIYSNGDRIIKFAELLQAQGITGIKYQWVNYAGDSASDNKDAAHPYRQMTFSAANAEAAYNTVKYVMSIQKNYSPLNTYPVTYFALYLEGGDMINIKP